MTNSRVMTVKTEEFTHDAVVGELLSIAPHCVPCPGPEDSYERQNQHIGYHRLNVPPIQNIPVGTQRWSLFKAVCGRYLQ